MYSSSIVFETVLGSCETEIKTHTHTQRERGEEMMTASRIVRRETMRNETAKCNVCNIEKEGEDGEGRVQQQPTMKKKVSPRDIARKRVQEKFRIATRLMNEVRAREREQHEKGEDEHKCERERETHTHTCWCCVCYNA